MPFEEPLERIEITKSSVKALRKRSRMYLRNLHQKRAVNILAKEALCIALDAIQNAAAAKLEVDFLEDGSVRITDDGPGLEIFQRHDTTPFPQSLLTELYACSHHKSEETRHFCGIGIVATNAFSAWLTLDVYKDRIHWQQSYREGDPTTPFSAIGGTEKHGNSLHFLPDWSFFRFSEFDRRAFATAFVKLKIPGARASVSNNLRRMTMTRES
jgi:DNA gyrase/topoisomerase IV subunit B